jgi:rRNA maturation endonuclease Nob1
MSAMKDKMIDKMNEDREHDEAVQRYAAQHDPEMMNNDDDSDEDEIFGYECLGCGHVQNHPGECDICMGTAVDPMYF